MSRVAIIGSCITRDLWPIRGAEGAFSTVSRTSFASLFSKPLTGFRPAPQPPHGMTKFQHRSILADLKKTALTQLMGYRPTHIIFDFIDERFDLLAVGGGIYTHSWELEASGYLGRRAFGGARPVPRLSQGCERLWRDGAAELAALIGASPLKDAQVILHSARWATSSRDARGRLRPLYGTEILAGRPASSEAHNRLLEAYEAEFLRLLPAATVVAAPEHRIADERHEWGLSPFHYMPDYYREIIRQLEPLGVEGLTLRGAGPSVRAA